MKNEQKNHLYAETSSFDVCEMEVRALPVWHTRFLIKKTLTQKLNLRAQGTEADRAPCRCLPNLSEATVMSSLAVCLFNGYQCFALMYCVLCTCLVSQRSHMGVQFPGMGVRNGCEWWGQNLGPLQEQAVLLNSEPSLQHQRLVSLSP